MLTDAYGRAIHEYLHYNLYVHHYTSAKQSGQIPATFKTPNLRETNTAMTSTITVRLG